MTKQIRLGLVGSGSGSTGAAAIDAFHEGKMPSVDEIVAFVSTVSGAGLLQKAEDRDIMSITIDEKQGQEVFHQQVRDFVENNRINLLVSAGCRVLLPNLEICMANTHPHSTKKHGGRHQVGLEPHRHFLVHEVLDALWRERANVETKFFAEVTFHYLGNGQKAIESVTDYDSGDIIEMVPVLMTKEIMEKAWSIRKPCRHPSGHWDWDREKLRWEAIDALAQEIQNHVLIHERLCLPVFIEHIAKQLKNS